MENYLGKCEENEIHFCKVIVRIARFDARFYCYIFLPNIGAIVLINYLPLNTEVQQGNEKYEFISFSQKNVDIHMKFNFLF